MTRPHPALCPVLYSFLLAAGLSGCAGNAADTLLLLEKKDAEIEALMQQASATEQKYARRYEEKAAAADAQVRLQTELAEDYRKQVLLKESRITELEKRLRDAENYAKTIKAQTAERAVVAAAEPVASPGTHRGLSFPVRVFDVVGEHIITGSHTRKRFVESDETFRDDFGNIKPVVLAEDQLVNQYGYQVTFSAENLTGRPQDIEVRAGMRSRRLTIPPNAVATNQTVTAAKGSGLRVAVGGQSRSFEVTY